MAKLTTFCKPFWALSAFAAVLVAAPFAQAANYFVQDTIAEKTIDPEIGRAAADLIKTSVSSRASDTLVDDESRADYTLQPRIMKLGDNFIITVEKMRGRDVLFAAQTKIDQVEKLDRAARSVTYAAIDEPTSSGNRGNVAAIEVPSRSGEPARAIPYDNLSNNRQPVNVYVVPSTSSAYGARGTASAATASASDMTPSAAGETSSSLPDAFPPGHKIGHWSVGFGPFMSRHLDSDRLMYNFAGGYTWDINPKASMKVLSEIGLSSGGDSAKMFNFATGASFFLPGGPDTTPYVTADIGYGFANAAADNNIRSRDDAEGFSFGTGVGFQFFRTTQTTMDLLLRYSTIFDSIRGDANPSMVGLRLGVNF